MPATSSGCDIRPSGTSAIARAYASSRGRPVASRPAHAISVSTQPGQTAFTWTFSGASSAASERTRPSSPAFEAE